MSQPVLHRIHQPLQQPMCTGQGNQARVGSTGQCHVRLGRATRPEGGGWEGEGGGVRVGGDDVVVWVDAREDMMYV